MLKKFLLPTLLLSTVAFAGEIYNIEAAVFKKVSFETEGMMTIYGQESEKKFKIDIKNKVVSITDMPDGGKKSISIANIDVLLPNHKSKTIAKVTAISDKYFRTLKITEEISVDGKKKTTTCTPDKLGKKLKTINAEIGTESEKETFTCDDGTKRSMKMVLSKGEGTSANINILNYMEIKEYNPENKEQFVIINVREMSVINIEKDGHINSISGKSEAKLGNMKMFLTEYKADRINQ